MDIISCKDYVEIKKNELKNTVSKFNKKPCLLVIQIDSNSASNSYINGKKKDCNEVGILCKHMVVNSETTSQQTLCNILTHYANSTADGIIIQLPIPQKYDLDELLKCIPPEKDVDGFKKDSLFNPCTPKGIIDWLDFNNVDLYGKDVVVIGRSNIVGKPLTKLLIEKGATVTCCNSKTKCLQHYTRYADIVISAVGIPKNFNEYYFSQNNQIIIDVGINRDKNNMLCGDIKHDKFNEYFPNAYITPVPGGVGLLTRLALLQNTVSAYMQNGGK